MVQPTTGSSSDPAQIVRQVGGTAGSCSYGQLRAVVAEAGEGIAAAAPWLYGWARQRSYMHRILWVFQLILAIVFLGQGILKFAAPDNLPEAMSWLYDMSPGLKALVGVAELAAAIGLILPAVTRIRPELVVWAAAGLVVTMVGAAVWHAGRDEMALIPGNLILAAMAAFVGYGRWKLAPLTSARPQSLEGRV